MIATEDRPLEGFEQRLLDELLAEAAARPPVLRATPTGLPPHRRRRWQLAAAAGLATAGAFAVLSLLPSAEQTARLTGGRDVPGVAAVSPEPASAAAVRTRALAAMAGYDDAIIHAVQVTTTPDGAYRTEMWFDEAHPERLRTLAYDLSGTPELDSAWDGREHAARTVDHRARTWSETRAPLPEDGVERAGPTSFAARGMLDAERLTLLERTRVRGRAALVLADEEPGMHRRLVIDAETYLPLRMTASWAPGEHYVIDYRWLLRTPATAALLWPDPPAGYQRVAGTSRAEQEAEATAKGTGLTP